MEVVQFCDGFPLDLFDLLPGNLGQKQVDLIPVGLLHRGEENVVETQETTAIARNYQSNPLLIIESLLHSQPFEIHQHDLLVNVL